MSDERYPAELAVTANDLAACGWQSLMPGAAPDGYASMWQAFSGAARVAVEEGRQTHGKALWLLADICSMMLNPQSMNEPFKPSMQFGDRRTALPDDLTEADVAFLKSVIGMIDDPRLKARVADVVWLRQKPRDVSVALAAIDAYRTIPLDAETWFHGGHECWERAVYLARILRSASGDRLAAMETNVADALLGATHDDGFLGVGLSRLLESNGLGRAKSQEFAAKLKGLAQEFNAAGNPYSAREYFTAAGEWFRRGTDNDGAINMTIAVAETFVAEAVDRSSGDQASHMIAAHFYEKAIQIYRSIPKTDRVAHAIDERIAALRIKLTEAGSKSLGELKTISSGEIDISGIVDQAREAVRGKSSLDSLRAFVGLHSFFSVSAERERARKSIQQFPLQHLFAGSVLSRDGRVIAKRTGLSLGGGANSDDAEVVRSEMMRNWSMQAAIAIQATILPALETLILEHRIRESDFTGLARQSPIVPSSHAILFGKALSAGYGGDFATALHLLAPQVENLVRFHLKQAGVKTTNLDSQGIENENGLSALMELPDVVTLFGEDLAFELVALFTDPLGPNLRNEVAHGLIDDEAAHSVYSIYAWWLGLKLVFTVYWNELQAKAEKPMDGVAPPYASE